MNLRIFPSNPTVLEVSFQRSQGLGSRNWFHKGTQKKAAVRIRCQHSYRYLTTTFHPLDLLYLWEKMTRKTRLSCFEKIVPIFCT